MSVPWLLRINEIRKGTILNSFSKKSINEFLKSSQRVWKLSTCEELCFKKLTSIEFVFLDSIRSRGTTVFVAAGAVGVDTGRA